MSRVRISGVIAPATWCDGDEPGWTTSAQFDRALSAVDDDLVIEINSYGGDVAAANSMAISMYAWRRNHPDREMRIEVLSVAYSAAAYLVASAPSGCRVVVHPQTMLMYHGCFTLVEGGAEAMRDMADAMEIFNRGCIDLLDRRTTLGRERIAEWFREGRAGWLGGAEAVECGLADVLDEGHDHAPPAPPAPAEGATEEARMAARFVARELKQVKMKADFSDNIPTPKTKDAEMEERIAELEARIAELEQALAAADAEKADLRQRIADLEAERDRLAAEIAEKDARIAELEARVAELEGENGELTGTVDKLTAGLKASGAPAAAKSWQELMSGLPKVSDVGTAAWDAAYRALQASHPAEFEKYKADHSTRY